LTITNYQGIVVQTTTMSSNSDGSIYLSDGSSSNEVTKLTASGVAPAIIIATVLSAIFYAAIVYCKPAGELSADAAEFKGRAANAWRILFVGVIFQTFGLIAGLAAPAIPWMSAMGSNSDTSVAVWYTPFTMAYSMCSSGSCTAIASSSVTLGGEAYFVRCVDLAIETGTRLTGHRGTRGLT
jgi:hypothetical protein